MGACLGLCGIPYSQKYWQEFYFAVLQKLKQNCFWRLQSEIIIIHKIMPHSSIKSTSVYSCVNHGDVSYRQLRERAPRLQALFDPDHWRNIDLQKGTWEPYRSVDCCSNGEFHHGQSCTKEDLCSMLTISAPKWKHCSLYNYLERAMFGRFTSRWIGSTL